mgnify:CR=1 FL=1
MTWNDELDIAPEYLYIHGKTVNGKKEIRNMFQKPNGSFYWTWTSFKKASDKHKNRKFKMHPTVEIYFENVETAIIEKKYCNYVIRDDKVVQFSCYLNKIKPNLYDNKNIERIDYWRFLNTDNLARLNGVTRFYVDTINGYTTVFARVNGYCTGFEDTCCP